MGKNSIKAVVNGTTKRTIGLDLGDQYSYFCLLDEAGEKVEWGRVKTSGEALEKRFGGEEVARMVVEAGTHSPWVSRACR